MSSRKKFLYQASALTAGTFLASAMGNNVFAIFKNRVAPSDQVNIGVIGINGMGWSNLKAILKVKGVNLVALCDVDKNVLDKRLGELKALNIDASKVKTFNDHRQLLDLKEVDAVIIGTPDHWHCLQMVDACQAGKDVYVEKPVGNSIEECRIMMAAQKKYDRVVQAGQWQRSQQHFKDAVDFISTGQLGNIRTVKVWSYVGWKQPIPFIADSPVPAGVDYGRWLGPATQRPFNANRFHFTFRWFWDYAGGLMTDWGVHLLDYALLGMKATVPKTISAIGGNFAAPSSPQETPDTLCATYQFEKFNLIWDHAIGIENGLYKKDHGIAFIGNNGTLELDRSGWEVMEEGRSANKVAVERKKSMDNGLDKHMENFVSVIRTRKMSELKCSIEEASHIAILSQMGNIAYRSGNKLYWNKEAGKFTDNSINRKYIAAPYHNGYKLPKI
ncbi:MAG: Gfo/Idh/MocA family oxidoreductase [Bacteroidota bacterium]|nr:Gfo/Idh/MocA family oxidoreductase [Bacteroidota bacterium]